MSKICVNCGEALSSPLYIDYGNRNIRLLRCPKCDKIADPYVEFDKVQLIIEAILLREQVYRHLLFNRLNKRNFAWQMFLAVISADIYTKWKQLDFLHTSAINNTISGCLYTHCRDSQPARHILASDEMTMSESLSFYIWMLVSSACENFLYTAAMTSAVLTFRAKDSKIKLAFARVLEIIILSQLGKLAKIVIMIWDRSIELPLMISILNLDALLILLKLLLDNSKALLILSIGLATRFCYQAVFSYFILPEYPCTLAAVIN